MDRYPIPLDTVLATAGGISPGAAVRVLAVDSTDVVPAYPHPDTGDAATQPIAADAFGRIAPHWVPPGKHRLLITTGLGGERTIPFTVGVASVLDPLLPVATESDLEEKVDRQRLSVNVKDFGAVGDGATSDQAAINAAVAALPSSGGAVFFPGGTYLFHDFYWQRDGLTFFGDGDATLKTTRVIEDTKIAFRVRGNDTTLRGLRFVDANKVSGRYRRDHTTANLNLFENGELVRLEGIQSSATVKTRHRVQNCEFDGGFSGACVFFYCEQVICTQNRLRYALGNHINVANCRRDVLVSGNQCFDCSDDSIAIVGEATNYADGSGAARVVITGNVVDTSDAKGITTTGANKAIIAHNHVRNTATFAIGVFADTFYNLGQSFNVIVEGNTIEKAGACFGPDRLIDTVSTVPNAIRADGKHIKIRGNLILDTVGRGIDSTGIDHVEIEGNSIIGTGDAAISLGNPDANPATFAGVIDALIHANYLRNVAGGITIGNGTGAVITDNLIRSFKNGASGSRRAIFYGYLKKSLITANVIINDDGAEEGVAQYPGHACPDTYVDRNVVTTGADGAPDTSTFPLAVGTASIRSGTGSPEGVLALPVGSIFLRTDGSANTTLYVKVANGSGSTGWADVSNPTYSKVVQLQNNVQIAHVSAAPEGSLTAETGSLALRRGAGNYVPTLWTKNFNGNSSSGWSVISPFMSLGDTNGKTSAQIDGLFGSTPPDGTNLWDDVNKLHLHRRGGKWHKSAAYTQIA